jgi:hypothetical protein
MMPKSGYRFSDKIMLQEIATAEITGCPALAGHLVGRADIFITDLYRLAGTSPGHRPSRSRDP